MGSDKSNCEYIFLLNLGSIGNNNTLALAYQDVTPSSNISPSIQSLITVFTPPEVLTTTEENVITYIAGYICHKITPKVCDYCKLLIKGHLNPAIGANSLISFKQYAHLNSGGLLVPSQTLGDACTLIETEYRANINHVLHMSYMYVRSRFVTYITKKVTTVNMSYVQGRCKFVSLIVNLCVNVRLHHTLNIHNRDVN